MLQQDNHLIVYICSGEAAEEGVTALDRPSAAVPPTGGAEFDFEEIMSDEEELPEYQVSYLCCVDVREGLSYL